MNELSQLNRLILCAGIEGQCSQHEQAVSMVTPSLMITQDLRRPAPRNASAPCRPQTRSRSSEAPLISQRSDVTLGGLAPGINEGTTARTVTSRSHHVTTQRAGHAWHRAPEEHHGVLLEHRPASSSLGEAWRLARSRFQKFQNRKLFLTSDLVIGIANPRHSTISHCPLPSSRGLRPRA